MPRRAVPVEGEGERLPTGLGPQLLLPDIVRPAPAGLADATAHRQHVDDAAVDHVHVVPVVERGADDDHRAALGLVRVLCELPRDCDHLVARDSGDSLLPGWRIGHIVIEARGHVRAAEPAVQPIVRNEQIVDRGDQRFAVLCLNFLYRHVPPQHLVMVGAGEIVVAGSAEIRESDRGDVVADIDQAQPQLRRVAVPAVLFLDIPLSGLAPAEADRADRADQGIAPRLVHRDRLPFGIVGLPHCVRQVGGAQHTVGHKTAVGFSQRHQKRHVGIAAAIVFEIRAPARQVPFPEDHVTHRHRHRSIGALLRVEPDVGEFRGLAVVGRDRYRGRALVADFGHEMGVRRACLRHVRAPHHQEGRVVPVGAFRHVGLLAPGLRAGRRQIAIPVVEAHADAADQRQVARARCIGDHRHGRNRREADDAVRSVGLDRVDIGRRDDLVDLVPVGAHEAA